MSPVRAKGDPNAIDEKKLLRKIDLHLLPGLCILLLLSFLDRSNGTFLSSFPLFSFPYSLSVGNARIEGLVTDTHMSTYSPQFLWHFPHHNTQQAGNQFLTTLTVYFVGYIVFDIPCNIALKLTSPRLWLPTLTLLWGVVCTLTALTQSFGGFLTARFFLGVTESGYFPGVMFYLSMWYSRNEQLYRFAMVLSSVTLGGAFGGLFVSCAPVPLQIDHS